MDVYTWFERFALVLGVGTMFFYPSFLALILRYYCHVLAKTKRTELSAVLKEHFWGGFHYLRSLCKPGDWAIRLSLHQIALFGT